MGLPHDLTTWDSYYSMWKYVVYDVTSIRPPGVVSGAYVDTTGSSTIEQLSVAGSYSIVIMALVSTMS